MDNNETGLNKDGASKSLVLTRDFEAVRNGLPNFDLAALDDAGADQSFKNNISAIAQGATQQNKVAFSANRQLPHEQEKSVKAEQQAARDDEARQLMHLMEWNARKTIVGDVEMTNEEAQEARQRVIDNDDYYARWAVKKGLIREDQIEEFKAGIRLKKECEDKRGRDINTADDDRREAAFDRSNVGKATEAATGRAYQDKDVALDTHAENRNADSTIKTKSDIAPLGATLFQSAPKMGTDFSAAKSATVPLDTPPDKLPSSAPSRDIKAMGFDV